MERNTNTIAGELVTGDRFYKAGGKDRAVLEVVEKPCNYDADKPNTVWVKKDGSRWAETIGKDVAVVFLRHTTE